MDARGLDAWLGDAADEVDDEQRQRLHAAADIVDRRLPGEDYHAERLEAFSVAAQVILGDDTAEAVAERWRQARVREQDARTALTGAVIAEVVSGESEAALAVRLDIARDTVRKALGKRRSTR